ncbi:MAG: CinA family protein [Propionicimonas sp.]
MGSPDRAARIVAALKTRGELLATAESLTGGLLGAAITAVPGASAVYLGGVVAYATAMKHSLAGVDAVLLADAGPVSERTAIALANGVRAATGADWAAATTGVAGPDPQDGHQPGEVWVGLAGPLRPSNAVRYDFSGDRGAVREATVVAALELLAGAIAAATSGRGNNDIPRGVEAASMSYEDGQVESRP